MFIWNNFWVIIIISSADGSWFNLICKIWFRNISLIFFIHRWVIVLLFSPNEAETQLTWRHCNILFVLRSIQIHFIFNNRWVFLYVQFQMWYFIILFLHFDLLLCLILFLLFTTTELRKGCKLFLFRIYILFLILSN
jgi:hypothetical protein